MSSTLLDPHKHQAFHINASHLPNSCPALASEMQDCYGENVGYVKNCHKLIKPGRKLLAGETKGCFVQLF